MSGNSDSILLIVCYDVNVEREGKMPKREPVKARVIKYVKLLNCSYAEAVNMVRDDDIIDAGGICEWETNLSPEDLYYCRVRSHRARRAPGLRPDDQMERRDIGIMSRSRTSTEVKRRYNEKAYSMLAAQLPKQLVTDFKDKCRSQGISQASVIRNALERFVA